MKMLRIKYKNGSGHFEFVSEMYFFAGVIN